MPRKKAALSRASIQSAVEAFKKGEFKSVWATAKAFNVSETTLRARINGRVTQVELWKTTNRDNCCLTRKKQCLQNDVRTLLKLDFPQEKQQ